MDGWGSFAPRTRNNHRFSPRVRAAGSTGGADMWAAGSTGGADMWAVGSTGAVLKI